MSRRALLTFLIVPIWIFFERTAYYGMRTGIVPYLMETDGLGLPANEAIAQYSRLSLMVLVAPFIGGLLAIATGPRVTLLMGAFVSAVAYSLLGSGWSGLTVIFSLIALGRGLAGPSLWAIAALDLADSSENRRNALFFAAYLAVNAGALIASLFFGRVFDALRPGGFFLSAIAMVVPLIGAAVLLGFDRTTPRPELPRPAGVPEAGSILLAFAAVPAFFVMSLVGDLHWASAARLDLVPTTVSLINPAVSILFSVLGLVVFLVVPDRVRTLHLMGTGSVLLALAALPMLFEPTSMMVFVSIGVAALGEISIGAGVIRVAAGVHPRAAAAMVACWMIISLGAGYGAPGIQSLLTLTTLMLIAGASLSFAAGAAMILGAKLFDDTFYR